MNYKMKPSLIPMPNSHKIPLLETLELYDRGEVLTNSPMIQSRIGALHQDNIGKLGSTEALLARQKKFIDLYESIKKNGYKGNPLWVFFDSTGQIRLYDGFHRLAVLLHLGIDIEVPVTTDWKGIDGTVGKDFPLVETLMKEAPTGKSLYQPVLDPRFNSWYVDRPDSQSRLDYLLTQMVGNTVLDIGCSEGFFARELAKRGYRVTAIDSSPGMIASARYLSIVNNLSINYHVGDWYDISQELGDFDNILMLSVVHNDMKIHGVGRGVQRLWALNKKAKRLFLEVPNNDNERQWNKPGYPNWDMHSLGNLKKLEVILGMDLVKDHIGHRSIFTFSDKPSNYVEVDTVHGFPIIQSKDEAFITHWMLEMHDWEPETTDYIKRTLKPGQTFVDVGANAGYFTVLASKLVGEKGKVYAFEPASDTYKTLIMNVMNLENVTAFNMALSDFAGEADFFGGENTGQRGLTNVMMNGKDVLQRVKVTTLDKFDIKPDMIKIDTEGNEADVIRGAQNIISDNTILVVENGNNIPGYHIIGQSTSWKPFNFYLKKGAAPKTCYHLIGLAHTKSNKDYIPCAITQNVVKLGKILTNLGETVYHYGAEGSDLPCTEHIDCISDKEQFALYGDGWKTGFFDYKKDDAVYQKFNRNAIMELKRRVGPRDIILVFNGNAQKPITDALKPTMAVEASVGYEGVYLDKAVFESYSWMHYIYAKITKGTAPNGRWYDAVIPLAVDPDDFVYGEKKDDYFLYAGRIIQRKGVHIAQQVCDKLGAKLIIMGQGKLDGVVASSPNITHVGVVGTKERAELFANAKGLFAPTIYLEPFGAIVAEAAMSGTPVITTDWGAFPETVIHGTTGYRCRTFDDFIWAAKNIGNIKPEDCRSHAMNSFSIEKVQAMYKEYFIKLKDLFNRGWYEEHPDRTELNWLLKG